MRARHSLFIASFAISLLVIAAVCAFMAVDLSTDMYMSGRFGSFFRINQIDSRSFSVTIMGEDYIIGGEQLEHAESFTHKYRGFLPSAPRLAGNLVKMLKPS